MTRRGKIARLPHAIRTQLNQRLRDGQSGPYLLNWLNDLPEAKQVLATQFTGVPISDQNLSEWRQGGYQDWLGRQDAVDFIAELAEQSQDLKVGAGTNKILSDQLALLLTGEMARATQALLTGKDYPEDRFNRLKAMVTLLNQIRRHDHHAARIDIEFEKWCEKFDDLEAERRAKAKEEIFRLKAIEIAIEQERAQRHNRGKKPAPDPTDDSSLDSLSPKDRALITSPTGPPTPNQG